MPLSKSYTLATVRGMAILWMKQMNISTLDPDLVEDFVKLAVRGVFLENQDALFKLYGETAVLSDSAAAFLVATEATGTFDTATKTITKTTHGLTNNDIGKRIIFGKSVTGTGVVSYITIAIIISITNGDNFVVSHTPGVGIPTGGPANVLFYAVLPFQSDLYYDLSYLNINRPRKLTDSLNGEVVIVDDARDFENLSRYPQKQNKVYGFFHGERLEIYQGSNVASLGTHKLYYYAMPADPATEDDYLDIPDDYIPQVVTKTCNFIISHITKQGPGVTEGDKSNQSRQVKINQEKELEVKK